MATTALTLHPPENFNLAIVDRQIKTTAKFSCYTVFQWTTNYIPLRSHNVHLGNEVRPLTHFLSWDCVYFISITWVTPALHIRSEMCMKMGTCRKFEQKRKAKQFFFYTIIITEKFGEYIWRMANEPLERNWRIIIWRLRHGYWLVQHWRCVHRKTSIWRFLIWWSTVKFSRYMVCSDTLLMCDLCHISRSFYSGSSSCFSPYFCIVDVDTSWFEHWT